MRNPALLRGYGIDLGEDIGLERRKRRVLYRIFYSLLEAYVEFEKYGSRQRYDGEVQYIKELLAELDKFD